MNKRDAAKFGTELHQLAGTKRDTGELHTLSMFRTIAMLLEEEDERRKAQGEPEPS